MPPNVDEEIRTLRPAQRQKIEAPAAELMAEEMSLRDLRKARKFTQVRISWLLRNHLSQGIPDNPCVH
jgi:hypothetical protein